MEPVFMYWDKVKFENNNNNFKDFTVKFSNGDSLDGVFFKKNKDYYITSLSSVITLEKNVKELKDYEKIKKISDISNTILQNGIEHLYKEKKLELVFEEQKINLQADKSNRKLSLRVLEVFDEKTKKKKLVSIYSPYEELKDYGLTFENKSGSVYKYTINLITERNNLFLEKKLFFDKKKIIEDIKKDSDRKNTFFIKHNGVLKAYKLELTDFLAEQIDSKVDFDFMKVLRGSNFKFYFFGLLFHGYNNKPRRRLPHIFTAGGRSALTDLHPIAVNYTTITIKGGVDFYLTPELYAKNKSIFKDLAEIGPPINVTQKELVTLRNQLNDNDFTVSKLYNFRSKFSEISYQKLSADDFVIPDFDVSVKIKSKEKEVVDDVFKRIFEAMFYVLDNETNTSQTTIIPSND